MKYKHLITQVLNIILSVFILSSILYAQPTKKSSSLNSGSDYFIYYGGFDNNKVLQAQYLDLFVLDVRNITPAQVEDIRDGFDNILGTDDDVIVIGYLSIGEQDGELIEGDGTGPVYRNGSEIVYQKNGYASFYLDDKDRNGVPDKDGIWNSYYVNAGDTAWWEFNRPFAEDILSNHGCDGLFLDLVDTGGPNSWGLPYEWTAEGMIRYIEYLRQTYPGKYILANRGIFYFDPSLLKHYIYADRYRQSIDGLMIESYYATWDWDQSLGVYNNSFPYLRDHFAPLLNAHVNQPDGFDMFILDYLKLDQPGYAVLLDSVVKVTEIDQDWLISVSTILLDSIRYDTYHRHPVDNNPPTWLKTVGISKTKWNNDNLEIYWDKAIDQTLPVKYHLYISESEIDFTSGAQYPNITPLSSDISEYKFVIEGLDKNKLYKAALRASDSSVPENLDPNRKVIEISGEETSEIYIDGYFDDWSSAQQVDINGEGIELEGDTSVSPSCDLIDLWFTQDAENLFFSFSVGGPITALPYYYHVFIDEDNNPETGYHSDNSLIGIDIMCENGYLWRYSGTDGEWAWEYITQIDYRTGINNSSRVELVIPKMYLANGLKSVSFIYHINDSDESTEDDYAPNNYAVSAYNFTLVDVEKTEYIIPAELEMTHYVYPNPFNTSVTFTGKFNKVLSSDIEIKIFDIMGQLVYSDVVARTGVSGFKYLWNAEASGGKELSSGIYLFRIEGSKEKLFANGKIIYLK
jgi:hypothetical protein